jgi:predicted metalloprotease
MKWEDREESSNVEDRRGLGKTGLAVGGIGGVILVVVALVLGVDPQRLLNPGGGGDAPGGPPEGQVQGGDPQEERLAKFSRVIFHDTEVVWDEQFRRMGKEYRKPTLVLFSGQVESACGEANAAVGPFYCPGDGKVYIDLSFYRDMDRKLNAPGDFAHAYVIAHEVGHHVQKLLGYSRRSAGDQDAHRGSVRLELQADFLAGVWAHHAQEKFHFLEPGDVEAALHAAFEIGDDRLQKKARGYVVPDSFTHGTSRQRMRWFNEGFKTGDVRKAGQLFDLPYDQL